MKIINLTPHDISLMRNGQVVEIFPASRTPARVSVSAEIVGEINEEGGEGGTDRIRQTGRNRYLVDGRITTEYLKESLGIIIPEGDYETLGGYLMTVMGKIPKPRETYRLDSVLFVVEEADARSVKKVLIVLPTKVATLKKERSPS